MVVVVVVVVVVSSCSSSSVMKPRPPSMACRSNSLELANEVAGNA